MLVDCIKNDGIRGSVRDGERMDITIKTILMACAFAGQILIIVAMILPLKIKKIQLVFLYPLFAVWYTSVIYFSELESWWWVAFLLESIGALVIILYCDSGNIWRNYCFLWIAFQIANVLFTLQTLISDFFFKKGSYILIYFNKGIAGVVFESLAVVLDTYIVALILRRFLKKEYHGDGSLYRILVFAIFLFGTIIGYVRSRVVSDYVNTHGTGTAADVYIYLFLILVVALIGNILVFLYNKFEIAQLTKAKSELQTAIKNHAEQYRQLVAKQDKLEKVRQEIKQYRDNLQTEGTGNASDYIDALCGEETETAMLPLSGYMAIDMVFTSFYKRYYAEGMTFEYHIDELFRKKLSEGTPSDENTKEMDVAILLDNLFGVADHYCSRCEGDRFTLAHVKNAGGNLVVKVEFSKKSDDTLRKPGRLSHIKRAGGTDNQLRIVRKVVQLHHGVLDINDQGAEAEISLMLQGCVG